MRGYGASWGNACGAATCSSMRSSPNGKRLRDQENQVYLGKFRSRQKRFLGEIAATGLNLNGRKVVLDDSHSLPENVTESPVRNEICYSPMSEDSDSDSEHPQCSDTTPLITSMSESDAPQKKHQKVETLIGFLSTTSQPYPLPCYTIDDAVHPPIRRHGSNPDGRLLPSSPNGMHHSDQLRRAVLLRSCQRGMQPHCPPLSRNQDNFTYQRKFWF